MDSNIHERRAKLLKIVDRARRDKEIIYHVPSFHKRYLYFLTIKLSKSNLFFFCAYKLSAESFISRKIQISKLYEYENIRILVTTFHYIQFVFIEHKLKTIEHSNNNIFYIVNSIRQKNNFPAFKKKTNKFYLYFIFKRRILCHKNPSQTLYVTCFHILW